jgi:RNA polymerase sigma-70 factor (sigma-E family)
MNAQDETGFREFVAGRSPALLRTAYLLVGDRGRAEDLLQTALVKTYLSWDRIRDGHATEVYVRRILINTATSWWRRRWNNETATDRLPETAVADAADRIAQSDEVRRALLRLPARQRAAVVLRYYEDLGEAEVAEALGVSRGTVSRYLTRALHTLRTKLNKEVMA